MSHTRATRAGEYAVLATVLLVELYCLQRCNGSLIYSIPEKSVEAQQLCDRRSSMHVCSPSGIFLPLVFLCDVDSLRTKPL